jgi:fructose-1,6-bisphosphatase/inositol monophosphatase family enzyme
VARGNRTVEVKKRTAAEPGNNVMIYALRTTSMVFLMLGSACVEFVRQSKGRRDYSVDVRTRNADGRWD